MVPPLGILIAYYGRQACDGWVEWCWDRSVCRHKLNWVWKGNLTRQSEARETTWWSLSCVLKISYCCQTEGPREERWRHLCRGGKGVMHLRTLWLKPGMEWEECMHDKEGRDWIPKALSNTLRSFVLFYSVEHLFSKTFFKNVLSYKTFTGCSMKVWEENIKMSICNSTILNLYIFKIICSSNS